MSNHTLFVCQSCNDAAHKRIKPSQGTQLLEQLNILQPQDSPLTLNPVGCLWMCSRACVVAMSCPNQPTYFAIGIYLLGNIKLPLLFVVISWFVINLTEQSQNFELFASLHILPQRFFNDSLLRVMTSNSQCLLDECELNFKIFQHQNQTSISSIN